MMSNQRPRVVVQLSDDNSEFDLVSSGAGILTIPMRIKKGLHYRNPDANVHVVDNRTLVLSIRNDLQSSKPNRTQEMHFDNIGTFNEPCTFTEISSLIDQLLVACNNCCLLKFNPMKTEEMFIICSHIVNELEKRTQMLKSNLKSIKIEYCDIQKYDMINLFTEVARKRRRSEQRNEFYNIMELHRWFEKEYASLWSACEGHDCLDMHFTFSDVKQRVHHARLCIFNLYLDKMDWSMKNILSNFFENLGSDKPVKHCLLTNCLQEYFAEHADHEPWHTWLIFDVPLNRNAGGVTDDMLKLANAAYLGSRASENKVAIEISNIDSDIFFTDLNTAKYLTIGDNGNHNKKSKNILNENMTDSHNDLSGLSSWYGKIDDKFTAALKTMETYYKLKYEMKIIRICGDIKHLVRSIDQSASGYVESNRHAVAERDLQTSFSNYKECLLAFRNLSAEIDRCNHAELLKVYLKSKNYELAQQALQLKIQQLEAGQLRLTGAINDEIETLNYLKKNTKKLDSVPYPLQNLIEKVNTTTTMTLDTNVVSTEVTE